MNTDCIRRWHFLRWGEVIHPGSPDGHSTTVDAELYEELQRFATHFGEMGYFSPLVETHEGPGPLHAHYYDPDNEEQPARTLGRSLTLFSDAEGIGVEGQLSAKALEAFDGGELLYWSPALYHSFTCPHTGEVFGAGLRHLAHVPVPHNKNLSGASAYYDMDESWTAITEMEEHMPQPKEAAETPQTPGLTAAEVDARLDARLGPLNDQLGKLNETLNSMAARTAPRTTDMSEAKDLSPTERLAHLERQLELSNAENRVRAQHAGLDAPIVTAMAEVLADSPERYNALSAIVTERDQYKAQVAQLTAQVASLEAGGSGAPPATQMAEVGGGVGAAPPTAGRVAPLAQQAVAAGIPRAGAAAWIEARGARINTAEDRAAIDAAYTGR